MTHSRELFSELHRRRPFDRMVTEHVQWLINHLQRVELPGDTVILQPGVPCDRQERCRSVWRGNLR